MIATKYKKWPTNKEQHIYMKKRQNQNRSICVSNPNETWMLERLKVTGLKWTRQAQWGYRLFDFWNAHKGIVVEVDGLTHNKNYDSDRDTENYQISGILVIRVDNKDELGLQAALELIETAETWNERRAKLGLKLIH